MNRYEVKDQNGNHHVIESENLRRDGDWLEFTKMTSTLQPHKVQDPTFPGGARTVMIDTGAKSPQPIAVFYKPTSVLMLAPKVEEPSDGNDA